MAQLRLKRDSTTALLCYCLASILMTVTNKVVLSQYNFRLNFLLLGVQGGVTLLLLKGSSVLQLLSYAPFNWNTGRQWFQVSLALVAMIYTGSKALQFLSIPLVTVFKNITIIIIAYFERFVYNGAPVTGLMLGAFGLMLTSSLISAYSDIYHGKWVKETGGALVDDASQPSVFAAYFWMFMNCFTTAFYALVMRAKIKSVGFQDFDTVFYNKCVFLCIAFMPSKLTQMD